LNYWRAIHDNMLPVRNNTTLARKQLFDKFPIFHCFGMNFLMTDIQIPVATAHFHLFTFFSTNNEYFKN